MEVVKPPSQEVQQTILDEVKDETTLNNATEADNWSDTPLSELKEVTVNDEHKSNIDTTIQAVSEIESKQELSPLSAKNDNDITEMTDSSASLLVKTEKSNDIRDDNNSTPVKSASNTPQSNKTKRKSKSNRSKSSK